jgi:hypothetical protein
LFCCKFILNRPLWRYRILLLKNHKNAKIIIEHAITNEQEKTASVEKQNIEDHALEKPILDKFFKRVKNQMKRERNHKKQNN